MPRREERGVTVPELVVPRERKTDTLGATVHPALTNELPARRVMRVNSGREVADGAIHLSQQLAHDMLPESRLR
jgi:hypothetical protein